MRSLFCVFAGCGGFSWLSLTAEVAVFVSILPQEYFVKKIGDEHVNVQAFVGPGENPETFQPTISHVMTLSKADLYFSIGVPFERALLPQIKKTLQGVEVVDTQKGILLIECDGHHHGHAHHHHHELDPHTWLNPLLVKQQAVIIRDALSAFDPEHAAVYAENCAQFLQELDALHHELTAQLKPFHGRAFYVYHPAFGYFAKAYGIRQKALEFEGKKPSPKYLNHFIKKAQEKQIKAIYTQPQFNSESVEIIASTIHCKVLSLDPLAFNYFENMKRIADQIVLGWGDARFVSDEVLF